ncbi:MAG: hypothetical protein IKY82_02815 [Alistipes sp.]|nr:hypothetical protein [Alistipes sp.]
MKRFLLAAIIAVVASGCTSAYFSSAYSYDDLYGTHDIKAITSRQEAEAEVRRVEAEARKAEAEAEIAERKAEIAKYESMTAALNAALQSGQSVSGYRTENGVIVSGVTEKAMTLADSYVADSYESAYARRLKGFSSPTYKMPSSYFNLRYNSSNAVVTAYDPALYNIMVSGDEVWVEPKYITSMFGSWGAVNATVSFYSPWYFGWRSWGTYDPWYYRSIRSCWGFPHYSWWDWNWHMCYPHADIYRWTGSLGYWGWGWGGLYYPNNYWHHPQYHGHWTGHWGPVDHHYGGGGWSPSYHRQNAPRMGNKPTPKNDRGGSVYGSRNQAPGQQPKQNGASIVNRGSSQATPYRSPSNGSIYGTGSRGKSATAAIQQQRAADAARNSASKSRGSSYSTGRSSYTPSNHSVTISRSSSNSSSSSYSSGSSGASSSGGGSRSSGGGGGTTSSGSRGR